MSTSQKSTIYCYDKTAKEYALKFADELQYKHLDRILLKEFALQNKAAGRFIDLGCGPGQTTAFLSSVGIRDLTGTDISSQMILEAKTLHPSIHFEKADMLELHYPDQSFAAAIAFYAIVHFTTEQLIQALKEINRILIDDGQFLFSFHIGDQIIHMDDFLGKKVAIDFHFFETVKVSELLLQNGFEIIDVIERFPYSEREYPSKRAYIWVKRKSQSRI